MRIKRYLCRCSSAVSPLYPRFFRFCSILLFLSFAPWTGFAGLAQAPSNLESLKTKWTEVQPLGFAHAHNDYLHPNPLLDALDSGFGSIEADVFLAGNDLCVAHTVLEIRQDRTLRSLYLEPLRKRIGENDGQAYIGHELVLTLMIDFKTAAEPTFDLLQKQLLEYRDLFWYEDESGIHPGPVRIIISGNRPFERIRNSKPRIASVDGRPADLGQRHSEDWMPWISDSWSNHLEWKGRGEIPDDQLKKLRDLLRQTHAEKKKLRFWGTPDRKEVWEVLHREGVDLINTDRLQDLQKHFTSPRPQ